MNEQAFKDLTDPETLYWLGFIATDGSIDFDNGKERGIHIQLKNEDSYHLEKLRKYIDSRSKVRTDIKRGKYTCCSYKVGGTNSFVPRLLSMGITRNKTHSLKVIQELATSLDFWRGAIDGDGSIFKTNSGYRLGFYTASLSFANQYKAFMETLTYNPTLNIRRDKRNSTLKIEFGSCRHSAYVLRAIYYPGCLALERKKVLANSKAVARYLSDT